MKQYYYQYYDHLLFRGTNYGKAIEKALEEHDWHSFQIFAVTLNNFSESEFGDKVIYLPGTINVYDDETDEYTEIELNEETFKLIENFGYECG